MQNDPKQTARCVRPERCGPEGVRRAHAAAFRALYAVSTGVSGSARGEIHALCPPLRTLTLAVTLALLLRLACAAIHGGLRDGGSLSGALLGLI